MTGLSLEERTTWKQVIARYQGSDVARSIMQMVNTFVPLAALFYVMYRSLAYPYWVTLLLSIPAGGLLVRTFIIMHDCGHGSYFPVRRANELVGWITGVLTLTPYAQWQHGHALHHASSGDLERRGHGDVDTLTVKEYLALNKKERFKYRILRNPWILFFVGPIHFMIDNRFRTRGATWMSREGKSVWTSNIAIVVLFTAASLWIGWKAAFLIYFPSIYIAAAGGIWLFYVQHQFEDTYWREHQEWDYVTSAIRGSSYLELPAVLRWFTGNIGVHHVHHLGPRIPNYKLKECHDKNPLFHKVTKLTVGASFRTLRLTLWDEATERLIGFRDLPKEARS